MKNFEITDYAPDEQFDVTTVLGLSNERSTEIYKSVIDIVIKYDFKRQRGDTLKIIDAVREIIDLANDNNELVCVLTAFGEIGLAKDVKHGANRLMLLNMMMSKKFNEKVTQQ